MCQPAGNSETPGQTRAGRSHVHRCALYSKEMARTERGAVCLMRETSWKLWGALTAAVSSDSRRSCAASQNGSRDISGMALGELLPIE